MTPADTGVLAALAGLDHMSVKRLRTLLSAFSPVEALAAVSGRLGPLPPQVAAIPVDVRTRWREAARRCQPDEWAERCARHGVVAVTAVDSSFPVALRADPDPPAVLFVKGDLGVLDGRRVGIVGTRNATRVGLDMAFGLAVALSHQRVSIVSGLAKGIDGAAHRGALQGPGRPLGVVANGLDDPYPRQHKTLWADVAEHGVLLSEWPPGTEPNGFRFPLRNRILAALCEVLVVVESRERGGSLGTAMAALERQVPVMAVPGSVTNRAANGTNLLIRDGVAPVLDADDVLVALGLSTGRAGSHAFDPRPQPRGTEAAVLERCRTEPCTLDALVLELGLSLSDAAVAVARLERSGWVRESGGWLEPVASSIVGS